MTNPKNVTNAKNMTNCTNTDFLKNKNNKKNKNIVPAPTNRGESGEALRRRNNCYMGEIFFPTHRIFSKIFDSFFLPQISIFNPLVTLKYHNDPVSICTYAGFFKKSVVLAFRRLSRVSYMFYQILFICPRFE